jgi:hypothetical protein
LTSIQKTNSITHNKCSNLQKTTEEKDGSGDWPMSYFLDTAKNAKIQKLLRNLKTKHFVRHNRPLNMRTGDCCWKRI